MAEFRASITCYGFRNRLWSAGDFVKSVTREEYQASNGMKHFDPADDEAREWRNPSPEPAIEEVKEVERVETPASLPEEKKEPQKKVHRPAIKPRKKIIIKKVKK